jgi:hypothetical protein
MAHLEYHNNLVTLTEIFHESHKTLIEKIGIHLKLEPAKIDELVQLFVGDATKLKAMKDPNKPKRARTSYLFFCNEMRPKIKEEYPKFKMVDLSRKLGEVWKTYNEKDRHKYVKLAEKDRERFEEENENYKNKSY